MGAGTCSKVWIQLSAGEAVEFLDTLCLCSLSKHAGRISWELRWVCSSSTGSKCLEITSKLVSCLTRHCNELINVSLLQVWNVRKSLYPLSWGKKNQTKKQVRSKLLHGSVPSQRLWKGSSRGSCGLVIHFLVSACGQLALVVFPQLFCLSGDPEVTTNPKYPLCYPSWAGGQLMGSWVWVAAVGTGKLCVLLLGAGQNTKERLGWSPRAEKGRGVTGEEVLGRNNFIKNGIFNVTSFRGWRREKQWRWKRECRKRWCLVSGNGPGGTSTRNDHKAKHRPHSCVC